MQSHTQLPLVSRFEADLLTILQCFLGHVPRSQILPLLFKTQERPTCLSRTAVELVQDTLAKGATLLVAQEGWRQERFLRGGQIATGLLWERTAPAELGLEFSPLALEFLIWVTATPVEKKDAVWKSSLKHKLALGDRLLLTLAYWAVRDSEIGRSWALRSTWRVEPLCQLLFAADFTPVSTDPPLDFAPWLAPAGIAVLEAWQDRLAQYWLEMERFKNRSHTAEKLRAMGANQSQVLTAYLEAIDRAGRRDLARFLLVALQRLLQPGVTLGQWIGGTPLAGLRLADRQQTYRDALAVVGVSQHLARWQAQARGVGYFDDDYHAAQLWKSDWEAYNGDRVAALAHTLLDQTQWL